MNDPATQAKKVLEMMGITGVPAESLPAIAKVEKLRCSIDNFPDDPLLDGMLLFKNDIPKAIVVNTYKGKTGKHNFTFAHELGHYFLKHQPTFRQDGQSGIRCAAADITNAQKPREVEANRFAVEFLMPEERFKFDMLGAEIDFALITGLSNLYMVSKHACSNRILSLTQKPCVIIRTKADGRIEHSASRAAKGFLRDLGTLPNDTAAFSAFIRKWGDNEFFVCNADKWLVRDVPDSRIYECTHVHAESGTAMTILKW